ncbi:hypothetical protein BLNAU_656 [Blattamonas nauphoetae]|uniref:Integrator complex subunit 7 N-terminal domain-containing protein n=1 Tax=Blattamonas nauphoetae TaxID=2049346 RepID=A0ABQ9YK38_9EUKA|nr:hypothetical protein BLNAU_656 [Blattamonas nauphoetae]
MTRHHDHLLRQINHHASIIQDIYTTPFSRNASLSELATIFSATNDESLRVHVLKSFEASQTALSTLDSGAEFLNKIYKVIHSNNEVARATTLSLCRILFPICGPHPSILRHLQSSLFFSPLSEEFLQSIHLLPTCFNLFETASPETKASLLLLLTKVIECVNHLYDDGFYTELVLLLSILNACDSPFLIRELAFLHLSILDKLPTQYSVDNACLYFPLINERIFFINNHPLLLQVYPTLNRLKEGTHPQPLH